MRFKAKPQSWKIISGLSIVLISFSLSHFIAVNYFWFGIFMAMGIIRFITGFLTAKNEQEKLPFRQRNFQKMDY